MEMIGSCGSCHCFLPGKRKKCSKEYPDKRGLTVLDERKK